MTRLATKIRSLERCLFCLVFALSLHANSSTGAETERIQEIPSAFAPYWYVDESTDSFIQVKNHLSTQLTVVPVLTLGSGESIKLSPLTIAPFATKNLSLKSQPPLSTLGKTGPGRWGDVSRSNSFIGNARLIPVDPLGSTPNDFSAWILVESPTERLGVVSMFEKPINALGTVREGLWWLPYPDAQAYYAVQNTSSTSLDVEMQLYVQGKLAKQRSLKLGPFAFQLIDVAKELGLQKAPELLTPT